jgi:hypothetical protein
MSKYLTLVFTKIDVRNLITKIQWSNFKLRLEKSKRYLCLLILEYDLK